MPRSYKVLLFADFPLPSYSQRAHRAVLFLDYAEKIVRQALVLSPVSKEEFKNKNIVYTLDYFKSADFKNNQYNPFFRICSIVVVFFLLLKKRFFGEFKDVDIIRVSNAYLILLARIIRTKKNIIVADCCDFYFDLYREFGMPLPFLVSPILFFIEKFALNGADILFVDTHAQRDFIVQKMSFPMEKCIVAPNGVLIENFPFLKEKDDSILNEYGFSRKDLILFYGGDISEMDGIEFVIRFMAENGEKYPWLKFLIIGKGNSAYLESLKRKIRAHSLGDKIIIDSFKPYDQAHRYISVADICLAPFRKTPTSNAVECGKIITYLLGGKVVLATEADGVKSLYKEAINYFRDGDYNDFCNKLEILIDQPSDVRKELSLSLRVLGEKFEFKKILEHEYFIIDNFFETKHQDFSKYDYL